MKAKLSIVRGLIASVLLTAGFSSIADRLDPINEVSGSKEDSHLLAGGPCGSDPHEAFLLAGGPCGGDPHDKLVA